MSDLVQKAKDAIERVFADTSVDPQETRDRLLELRDDIDTAIDALEYGE